MGLIVFAVIVWWAALVIYFVVRFIVRAVTQKGEARWHDYTA